MARKRDRIFALTLAIVFFATSVGASFYVIWELYNDNKEAKTVNQNNQQPTDQSKVLKGTKLAGFEPIAHVDGLQKVDTTPGTGAEVQPGARVTVDYTGALASTGVIFESSYDSGQTATFGLDEVIKGWTDGIPGMKEGGTRRLVIPADLAYGAAGKGSIPPNADLVFDVTVHIIGQ
jgi:FKBP-type peptidyl-prolyl cis-trans isomerase